MALKCFWWNSGWSGGFLADFVVLVGLWWKFWWSGGFLAGFL